MVTASGSTAASAASAVSMEVATAASTASDASSAASEMSSASGPPAVKSTSDGVKSDTAVAPFGSSLFKRFSSCVFLSSNTSRASCNPARLTLSAFVKPPSLCFCNRRSSWFVRSSHCATSSSNLMRFNVMTGLDDSRRAWMNCVVQACAQGKAISIIVARWGGSMSSSEVEARSRTAKAELYARTHFRTSSNRTDLASDKILFEDASARATPDCSSPFHFPKARRPSAVVPPVPALGSHARARSQP